MISIQKAKQLIARHRLPRAKEQASILSAHEKVLAEAVVAPFDSPRFDNSAMDGIAVKWTDVEKVTTGKNVVLELVGESSAGGPWAGVLEAGQAVRINTGAVVPDGADTVIPQEECSFEEGKVTVSRVKQAGNHVRRQGEEYRKSELLLAGGTPLNPAVTGVLGSIGLDTVTVYRSPRVSLMVTGTELAVAGSPEELGKGQIYDSNRPMLYHYLKVAGIDHIKTKRVHDEVSAISLAIEEMQHESDIIISTGGVSMGSHDHIPAATEAAGFQPVFRHVAQKPGKPLYFATSEESNTLYFGLPGNPVSAFMTFSWYVYPELCYYLGKAPGFRKRQSVLAKEVNNPRDRTVFLRVKAEEKGDIVEVKPVEQQGSHLIHALSAADGFVIIPPSAKWDKGQKVPVYFFPWY